MSETVWAMPRPTPVRALQPPAFAPTCDGGSSPALLAGRGGDPPHPGSSASREFESCPRGIANDGGAPSPVERRAQKAPSGTNSATSEGWIAGTRRVWHRGCFWRALGGRPQSFFSGNSWQPHLGIHGLGRVACLRCGERRHSWRELTDTPCTGWATVLPAQVQGLLLLGKSAKLAGPQRTSRKLFAGESLRCPGRTTDLFL